MRIVPLSPEQLRVALDEDAPGAAAEGWRLLREDVRALAPPLDPEFERRLQARLDARREPRASRPLRGRARHHRRAARADRAGLAIPPLHAQRHVAALRSRLPAAVLASGVAAAACALILALLAAGIFSGGGRPSRSNAPAGLSASPSSRALSSSAAAPAVGGTATAIPNATDEPPLVTRHASGRVQERSASITLAASPPEVQAVADGVSRLATEQGGYVISSQVNVQHERGGEATLSLSVPSARLTQVLSAFARLAPVRAQSQSLQDITDSYESARRTLADAVAERSALLRALARASTQGQIESLRRRLSLAGGAIARAKASLQSVSQRAARSRVEVSVLAAARAGDKRSTLARGVHDAGHLLAVVLVVLLIALAVLVPLIALIAIVVMAARRWRRLQREQALDRA